MHAGLDCSGGVVSKFGSLSPADKLPVEPHEAVAEVSRIGNV